ncbi:MAG: glycosyltransferase family 2 protein [Aquificae bacterium]|nr:glycosyltransferase family 2 protein [Aquificota bacterium]
MKDISVIILTYNEEKHIERCVKSLKPFVKDIFIVDSYSTDRTLEIAESLGAKIYQNKWVNYATQFQWALDNCPIKTKWVMRMDADEYIEPELAEEIRRTIDKLPANIKGIYLKRKVYFQGKWIRWGGFYPHILLRIWQYGYGKIEQRWMDEHIILSEGDTILIEKGNIVDDNKNNITWWIDKHNKYATREMLDLMNIKYKFFKNDNFLLKMKDPQAKKKRYIKEKFYSKLPLGLRPTLYFLYRYFFKLGFLDGWQGFIFHFMQGYWYRLLVDVKCWEFEKKLKEHNGDIEGLLKDEYGIKF